MNSYTLIAPAKINLYLEIIGDRSDGYHELAMILQSIELADRIELRSLSTDSIRVRCDHQMVPQDQSNLAYRAAELIVKQFPDTFAKYGGVEITITKHIPVAAGLAGGSTNAAAVLVGLNLLWKLGLTQKELEELGATLGSDVPFCIGGGTAIATGRGEQLSPLPNLKPIYLVLGKYKSLEVSTPWAYKAYRASFGDTYVKGDSLVNRASVHSKEILQAILHQDAKEIAQKMHNDLEKVVLTAHPQVLQLRETFASAGVLGTMMSGSGPTVFALCESENSALLVLQQVESAIANSDLELIVTRTTTQGIAIERSHS